MKRKSILVAVVFLLLWSCGQALAWNSIGHMSVAYVAYQHLTSAEKARAAALLKLNPYYQKWLGYIPSGTSDADRDMYVFMMAATWPDEIKAEGSGYSGSDTPPAGESPTLNKGYGDKHAYKYWHFIDTPFSTDGTALPAIPVPTAIEKIGVFRQALTTDESDALKSYDLVWEMHLVGDVHQPLHCTTRVTQAKPKGDEGGNLVAITGSIDELHAFWDDAVGLGYTEDFMKAVTVGKGLPEPNGKLAGDNNEADWAAESFKLAKEDVYTPPVGPALGPYTLNATYSAETTTIAEQRLALAAARLTTLIKTVLNCGADSCAN